MKKEKKDNTQKIIEAEANLQAAKMLQAIDNLKISTIEFGKLYDSDFEDFKKVYNKSLVIFDAVRQFNKHCSGGDLKIVTDIVDGIKLKSKYEMEIKTLLARIEAAKKVYNELYGANQRLRVIAMKLVGEELAQNQIALIEQAKQYKFDDVLDRLQAQIKPVDCKTSETPF